MKRTVRGVVAAVAIVGVAAAVVAFGLVGGVPNATATSHDGMAGNGTADDPYVVTDVGDLQSMADDPSAHYELGGDVDATASDGTFEPIGDAERPFTGEFDGNGHAIRGLSIDDPSARHVGLFGVSEGVIANVTLENADVRGGERVGALVGLNAGLVERSAATGAVDGENDVGGLVGVADGGVRESAADVDVTGETAVGGVVGYNSYGPVSDVRATGSVEGETAVGGLVGENQCCVHRAYAAGAVSGTSEVGGAVGRNVGGSVRHVYWDVNESGRADSAAGTGLSTGEMTGDGASDALEGFAFGETWTTTDAVPRLAWEADDRAGIEVNGTVARDLDGDGLYEDLNGNGDLDLGDAVDLFQHRESEAIRNNVDAFDFSGNGGIDLADVVALFREITA